MGVFSLGGIGAPCCCGCSPTTICVTGCSSSIINGATVTVKSGATVIGTCVTSGSGCCQITIPSGGSYTVVVSATGFTTNTSTHTLSCGGSTTISLGNPPAGTTCCGSCPVPNTLTLTDATGTCTLTHSGGAWTGFYEFSMTGRTTSIIGGVCTCSAPTTVTQHIQYQLVCSGAGTMTLTRTWVAQQCGGTVCDYGDWNAACTSAACGPLDPCDALPRQFLTSGASSAIAPSPCTPFAWTGTITDSFACCAGCALTPIADPVGTGSVAISA